MGWLYNCLLILCKSILPILGFFFSRIKVFYKERKNTQAAFNSFIQQNNKPIIWFHVASLGEYEQALPVAILLKKYFVNHSFMLTFFSDSGYRVKKNNSFADFETYLPLDTPNQAKEFVKSMQPEFCIFVKYDIWPNYLKNLKKLNVKTFLIAARFRSNQIYFRPYEYFFKNALRSFSHIFVQDQNSGHLLNQIQYDDWTYSGDTRFDRVFQQLCQNNQLNFADNFTQNQACMVGGSLWPEDEDILLSIINDKSIALKFILAPHQIKPEKTKSLQQKITSSCVTFTDLKNWTENEQYQKLKESKVLILDTVGLLSKVYHYADIAYVGGAMGNTGLHNILEPAVFGCPVLIGPNHKKFPEAKALLQKGGLLIIENEKQLQFTVRSLLKNKELRNKMSIASKEFITSQIGATEITYLKILQELKRDKN